DLVVHFGGAPPRGPWISHVVLQVREWLVATRTYLIAHGFPASIADLPKHDLLAWRAPGEDPHVWPTKNGASFRVDPVLVSSDIHFVRQCCLAGLGIALVPDALLPDPGFPADSLVPVLSDDVGRERSLRVTVPTALAEIPKIREVLALAVQFVPAKGPAE